jgi:hypothetical protein
MVFAIMGRESRRETMDDDLIRRKDAIDAVHEAFDDCAVWDESGHYTADEVERILDCVPSAQPEIKPINYRDCSNAMLKMWMYNVVTDGEYYRIMDKLYKHETERLRRGEQDG